MISETESDKSGLSAAMVAIHTRIPEQAMTAGLLGMERKGYGVRIRSDGLIATVGYLVIEAEQVWITTLNGHGSPAYVTANDYDSGIALLKTTFPLGQDYLESASLDEISVGDHMTIYRCGLDEESCELLAIQEFAGRWEYLLDEALFTSPPCEDWAGAALVNNQGQICGLGSLLTDIPYGTEAAVLGNMFIPTGLVAPYVEELNKYGRRNKPARPWMGMLIQEYEGKLIVVGIYRDCPADLAGIKPGEFVVSVDNEPVNKLSDMLRKVWSLGSAGVEISLTISSSEKLRTCRLQSIDRSIYYQKAEPGSIN